MRLNRPNPGSAGGSARVRPRLRLPPCGAFNIVLCAAKKQFCARIGLSCTQEASKRPNQAENSEEAENNSHMAAQNKQSAALTSPGYLIPFITVTALYFIFGFITNLNMQLVPHLKSVFDLPWLQAALANGAFFTAYFVVSSPTSRLIEAIGYKRTMVVSLFVQVAGALLFLPAASLPNFWLFLTAVFIVGSGVAMLQTSANPYVSALGPEPSAPIRQNLAQAFNSIGGMIAPVVAGALILKHKVVLDAAALATKTAQEQLAYKISIASTVRMPLSSRAVARSIHAVFARPIRAESGFASTLTARRPSLTASRAVVPLPPKGSKTSSPRELSRDINVPGICGMNLAGYG